MVIRGEVVVAEPRRASFPEPDLAAVARAAHRHVRAVGAGAAVTRLDGGYSWRTFLVHGRERDVVVRVAPAGGTVEPYDPDEERRRIEAGSVAVPTPTVLAVEPAARELGAPYAVHTVVAGRVLRLSAVDDPGERSRYRQAFASALGDLHARGDPRALDGAVTITEALRREVERVGDACTRTLPGALPGLVVALRWLVTHLPDCSEAPVLCHGDYRFGNLAWLAPGELGGVLDWERAWVGDPTCDVAFTRLLSGWCAVDGDAVAPYEAHAGRPIAVARLRYATRLEQVRSLLSSLTGLRALVDGRADDRRLAVVGEAGLAGAWRLVSWLGEGPLAPLPPPWRLPPAHVPLVQPSGWSALVGDDAPEGLRRHAAGATSADAAARSASLAALRDVPVPTSLAPALRRALSAADDEVAWASAHEVLADAAATGGPDLAPALDALARRIRDRPVHLAGPRPAQSEELG